MAEAKVISKIKIIEICRAASSHGQYGEENW